MAKSNTPTTPPPPANTPLSLTTHLCELVQACFTAIWNQTQEPAEAPRDLTSLCRAEGWRLGTLKAETLWEIKAGQNVVPVAITAGDQTEGLRQWASGRCLSADRAGVYSRTEGTSGGRMRRVVRKPGVN